MDISVNIRKAENGFILRYDDPDIVRKNRESEEYLDASTEVLAKNPQEALSKVQSVLTMMVGEEAMSKTNFDSAFDEAMNDE